MKRYLLSIIFVVSFFVQADAMAADLANSDVRDIKTLSNGQMIIVGGFTSYNGVARDRIARIDADGTLDATFSGSTFAGSPIAVNNVDVQLDGKYIVSGNFSQYGTTATNNILRLNTNGTLDTTFDVSVGTDGVVYSQAIQTDGKILIGGNFDNVGGVSRTGIARLNTDGTLDTSFDPGSGVNSNYVNRILVLDTGKIMVGGDFTEYDGSTVGRIMRLQSDGALDTTFDATSAGDTNGDVYGIQEQSDGRFVIGGFFTTYNGESRRYITRINEDGTLDSSFNADARAYGTYEVLLQSDGKILIGGMFTTVNEVARDGLARLNTDGTLDTSFDPGTAAAGSGIVRAMTINSNGDIIAAGNFTSFDGVSRGNITRVNAEGLQDETFGEDVTPPVITEVVGISSPTNDNTPSYTFNLSEQASYTMSGTKCLASMCDPSEPCLGFPIAIVDAGDHTINFWEMADDTYDDCTIIANDMGSNLTNFVIPEFTVDTTPPVIESIVRQDPADEITSEPSATLRITFSEPVKNVGTGESDFTLSGSAASAIAQVGSGTEYIKVSDSVYDFYVPETFDGEFYLMPHLNNDIEDFAGNMMSDLTVSKDQHYQFEAPPAIIFDDVSHESDGPIAQIFDVVDTSGVSKDDVYVNSSFDGTADVKDFSCVQTQSWYVSCSVKIISSGELIITASDGDDHLNTRSAGEYTINSDGDDTEISSSENNEVDIPKPDLSLSGKMKDLVLSSKKKIYVKKDEIKFKGEFEELAGGMVKIKYKRGSDSETEEVDIDENGKWSEKVEFDKDGSYKIKFTFFDKDGKEVGDKGYYKVRIDTEDPVIDDMPARLTKRVGDKVWWSATDDKGVKKYKYIFNGKKTKTKDPFFHIPSGTPPGTYGLEIRAYDKAGNKDVKNTTIIVR